MTVPFSPPLIAEDEIEEVAKVLRSGWIGTGPRVQEFERKLSDYLGAKHVLTTNSCTAALHLSLLTLGIKPGDEVITTPMTFAATANVIVHVGGKPIFADVSDEDWNIDPAEIRKKITAKTKAIIPVHLGGLPCDLDEIEDLAESANISVVEDAAHAIGAMYDGKMIGSSGNLVCLSFYPTKNITTVEGGAVCSSDREKMELINVLRLHGQSADAWKRYSSGGAKSYQVTHAGYKYNMTDVQAALGIKQLEKIENFLKVRDGIAKVYLEGLGNTKGMILPPRGDKKRRRVWHLFSVLIKQEELGINRDDVMERLSEKGVGTGIHYEALHLHPFYRRNYDYSDKMYPVAEYISSRTLSLPMSAGMTEDQALYVVDMLNSILKGN